MLILPLLSFKGTAQLHGANLKQLEVPIRQRQQKATMVKREQVSVNKPDRNIDGLKSAALPRLSI